MTRIIAMYLVPFLLPLTAYLIWAWYRQKYVVSHEGEVPPVERGAWPYFLMLGAVLTLALAGFMAVTRGSDPDATYTPARIENGKIVPGTTEKKSPSPAGP